MDFRYLLRRSCIVLAVFAHSALVQAQTTNLASLLDLAEQRFGSVPEPTSKLLRAVSAGTVADFDQGVGDHTTAKSACDRTTDVLNGAVLEWLCTDRDAITKVHCRGIHVRGARIVGAINLEHATIPFPIQLLSCCVDEDLNFLKARIRGLYLQDSQIKGLIADGLQVENDVFLNGRFISSGGVRLSTAQIGGLLYCDGGQLLNPNGDALNAEGSHVKGSVFLRNGFRAEGQVRFLRATIGGNLDCTGGAFQCLDYPALSGDGANIAGSMSLVYPFEVDGEVRFPDSKIGGRIDCTGAVFRQINGGSLNLTRSEIRGSVLLRSTEVSATTKARFTSHGEMSLLGSQIGGDLDCSGAKFEAGRSGRALVADGLAVSGSAFMRNGFEAHGGVSFAGALVDHVFTWAGVVEAQKCSLDLRSAAVGTLWDHQTSWPPHGALHLDGFKYMAIDENAPRDYITRLDWLRRQSTFQPQPFEQLAAVLDLQGQDDDAREIRIEKALERAGNLKLSGAAAFWDRVLYLTIAYGYKPWWAVFWMVGVTLLGWLIFSLGSRQDLIVPLHGWAYDNTGDRRISSRYPTFNALVYSLDELLPVINLRQGDYWLPSKGSGTNMRLRVVGSFVIRHYLTVHILLGWILTTLFIAGTVTLVQK